MKRIIFWCILLLAGCTQSPIEEVLMTPQEEFYAVIEGADEQAGSRTFLDEKIRLRWTADDRITIFKKTAYNREFRFTGTTGQNAGGFAQVSVDDEFWYGATLPYNYAAYPHSDAMAFHEDGYFMLTMPAQQQYTPNSVGLGANTMVAMSEGGQLMFKNVGSFLRVRLWGENQQVASIIVTTKGDEILAGSAKVTPSLTAAPICEMAGSTQSITLTCATPVKISDSEDSPTDFWIVLPPTTLADGFTVEVKNHYGNSQTFEVDRSFTFEQNTYYNLKREVSMGLIPDNQIWYTARDEQSAIDVNDLADKQFGATILSHSYDATTKKGIITFDAPVTTIGERAFMNSHFETVILPRGITSIENWGFNQCNRLTTIELGNQIISIGRQAFNGCTALSEIKLPKTIQTIGYHAFRSCRGLANVTIAEGAEVAIGEACFYGCTKLTHIALPSTTQSIGVDAFSQSGLTEIHIPEGASLPMTNPFIHCENLKRFSGQMASSDGRYLIRDYSFLYAVAGAELTTLTIPDGITEIGYYACIEYPIERVVLPNSLKYMYQNPFYGCENLAEFSGKFASDDGRCVIIDNELHAFAPAGLETTPYTIPTGVETILQQAFLGCDIQTITIPSSVKVIGNSAFKGASLANLYIEEGLEEITYFAFANCYSLTNITLPKSLKTLWDYAFDSCTQLESIYCPSTTPPAIKVEEGDEWGAFRRTHENLQIYVPIGSEEAYATADGWKNYADKIVGYDFSAEE